jgi:hypothetical protein
MTLSEAFLGIDPKIDLWKYFFHVRHPQDPEAELMISKGMVIHVKARHGVDPYLENLHAQIDEGVAEEMVLPEEQRFRSAPSVY